MKINVKQQFQPNNIFVEEAVKNTGMCQRILAKYPDLSVQMVADATDLLEKAAFDRDKQAWRGSILLAKQRGPFLRLCPGTQKHICCLYHNLDVAAGCDLGCTYCILQGYLNNPLVTFYCNTDDMFGELDEKLAARRHFFYRIGTGELSDSLTFEHINEIGPELVTFFSRHPNAIIELKSKNINVDQLLGLEHKGRTVMAWSMNSAAVHGSEEGLSASMDERLLAAREVQQAGYKLAFHFDPMIEHENWQAYYRETVDKIFSCIHPENIAWISLGALRYPAAFDEIVRENHPSSTIYLGELLPGIDKKLRYFKPLRINMFAKMHTWIKSYSENVFVYLCMENDQVWRNAFGWSPGNSATLKRLLDERVQ